MWLVRTTRHTSPVCSACTMRNMGHVVNMCHNRTERRVAHGAHMAKVRGRPLWLTTSRWPEMSQAKRRALSLFPVAARRLKFERMGPLQAIYWTTLFATTSIAFWRGGRPERLTAAALFAASLATPIVLMSMFAAPEFGVLVVDVMLLGWLCSLAITDDRFWPLPAAGFHLVGTIIHIVRIFDPSIIQFAYAHAQSFWAYPVFAALIWGSLFEAPAARMRQEAPKP